ncbi:MFS transporter [Streptococcus moroccensis]|uniref:OHS family lactose permease-like MFS transporter n=1 Tax=Streptococcus moroccensis TaxID=1451356 RepID=A0ABT9YST8_9STRE|nr:MFS transporter [Streptococcus moroccensis]MDQ0223064.1 OHS family lactose permease-like MFS transporter [Streptococcus moroccensis]
MKALKNSYWAYLLMYLSYYLSWAMFSSLISVYLLDLGFKASQVSLVVSISFVASMVSQPLIGWLNDQLGIRKVTWLLLSSSIIGGAAMLVVKDFWWIAIAYSWVLLLVNGSVPVMEKIATSSPFSYGKIRIWGTIGFALGSQLSGLIYDYISPKALFAGFILAMLMTLLGIWGTEVSEEVPLETVDYDIPSSARQVLFSNKTYLGYLMIAMVFSGVTNTGHTYIPAMLEDAGLSIRLATTVVAISVLCEAPLTLFSYKFMDQMTSQRIFMIATLLVCLQYGIYALDLGLPSKVIMTLLAKHTTGMLFIMVNMKIVSSLIQPRYLITALSLVQAVRSLGSIMTQNIVGHILDHYSYSAMSWFLAIVSVLLLVFIPFLKLPTGQDQKLYS